MKKMLFALIAMLAIAASARAMSYEQARQEALFLTDKMAYELNLTDAQYEAAYEINLDYLMGVTGRHDVFGLYWERRNADLQFILHTWQWEAYLAASYFYRPLFWEAGYWHFGIYARYPHRDYFYFGRPHFYLTYRGGHSWRMNGGHSYYQHHRDHFRPAVARESHFGMRDGWNRGDYRSSHGHGNSSTRVTGPMNRDNRGSIDREGGSRSGNFSGTRNHETRPSNSDAGNGNVRRQDNGSGNVRRPEGGSGSFSGSRSSNGSSVRGTTGNSSINRAPVSRANSVGSSAPRISNNSTASRMSSAPSRVASEARSSVSAGNRGASSISRSSSSVTRSSGSSGRSVSRSSGPSGGSRSSGVSGSSRGGGRR